jgi:radical SAM protein with 4Fe4S-binding SPASM domain
MEHLVIKPTLACTANCPTCAGRRLLHKNAHRQRQLALEDWKRVLDEARSLGAWHLTISGGEPTLYKRLPELIAYGKKQGWLIRLNSNGGLTDFGFAEALVEAGLDVADISLYSPVAAIHDAMRGASGLWRKATATITFLAGLKSKYKGFNVITQTILCRENYLDFARLLQLHYHLGSSGILISYLEGDVSREHLLQIDEIEHFRRHIIPDVLKVCRGLPTPLRNSAAAKFATIFSEEIMSSAHWAEGIYRPESRPCTVPQKQALVLANGDVHPCNIVEYVHEPIMGNLFEQSLPAVWRGSHWKQFRESLHRDCPRCPMQYHLFVHLRCDNKWVGAARSLLHMLRLERMEQVLLKEARRFLHSTFVRYRQTR